MCETTGTYNNVLPYLDHRKVIPGKIYYGLDFDDRSYPGHTINSHLVYPDKEKDSPLKTDRTCLVGKGQNVGICHLVGDRGYNFCPSTQRHIVHAWQRCAELCNEEPYCSTFTVHTTLTLTFTGGKADTSNDHLKYRCFLHLGYECKKENRKSAGIDNYENQEDVRMAKYDDLGVWSGICRTKSGRTNDYACTNTPHP